MCVCEDEEEVVVRDSKSEGRDPGWLGRVRLSQQSTGSFHFDSAQSFCGSGAPDASPDTAFQKQVVGPSPLNSDHVHVFHVSGSSTGLLLG